MFVSLTLIHFIYQFLYIFIFSSLGNGLQIQPFKQWPKERPTRRYGEPWDFTVIWKSVE
jgi:hypothetical protein